MAGITLNLSLHPQNECLAQYGRLGIKFTVLSNDVGGSQEK